MYSSLLGDKMDEVPKEVQEKLEAIKKTVEAFSDKATKKNEKIMGIAILPPKEDQPNLIQTLVLLDDRDLKFQEKLKFRDQTLRELIEISKKVDENIFIELLLLEELWQSCYDGKNEVLQIIAQSAPVFDKGMLAALRISQIHKTMVTKKFEKYVVSYVLAGSLVQGRATPESDIDVFVVVDDTDVKKMTRYELREKLRAIILGMGQEAGMITGVKNKINIQVYILTDFWDGIKEANPVYFTFLRDGVPLYDRGVFMPWKLLLKMGRIKPSPESIDMHMSTGDQVLKRTQAKLNEIGMEDMFWATLNPSQAALMLYGLPPPTPKETPELLRSIFVKKEKILEEEYVKIIEKIIKTRKDLEHDPTKKIKGSEVDKLLSDASKYLKRIQKLFAQIETDKQKEKIQHMYESVSTAIRDALKLEGVTKVTDEQLKTKFKNNLVTTGKIPTKATRLLDTILKAKKDYEANKLTKAEVEKAKKESDQLVRMIINYVQEKRGREIERTKVRIKHGQKVAEVTLLDDKAYIIDDLDAKDKQLFVATIKKDGSLSAPKPATQEDLEHALAKAQIPEKVFIKQGIFANLKDRYGTDSQVLITF